MSTGSSAGNQWLARFVDGDGRLCMGRVDGLDAEGRANEATRLERFTGSLFAEQEPGGESVSLASVQLLAPVIPSKVVAVASNYRKHAEEMGKSLPAVPKLFMVPSTAVVGPGGPIELPPGTSQVDHEVELAVVVGRTMCRVPESEVAAYILGYTVLNDVTARDFQREDGQFTRAKGFDSFCPLGPWIRTGIDPQDLRLRCWVDGELRQDGRTSDMVFGVFELLSFISGIMTLHPGDVVATGTPAGVGRLEAGQRVTIEVEGVGRMENPVVDRADREG